MSENCVSESPIVSRMLAWIQSDTSYHVSV